MPSKQKLLINIFDRTTHQPGAFFDWIEKNEDGFVINTYQKTSKKYVRLHSAKCGILTSQKRYGPDGATKGKYKKICSESHEALIDYLVNREDVPLKKITPCQQCDARKLKLLPPIGFPDEVPLTTHEALDEEGRKKLVTHFAIERSSRNRRIVLKSRPKPYACEACDLSLGVYGDEYEALIHVHHTRPIGQGVKTPEKKDFLLLCPNCHAVAHRGRALDPLTLDELREKAATLRARWATTT
jgi:Zn finger protein HypA/HybF involved in hydrogenase expression